MQGVSKSSVQNQTRKNYLCCISSEQNIDRSTFTTFHCIFPSNAKTIIIQQPHTLLTKIWSANANTYKTMHPTNSAVLNKLVTLLVLIAISVNKATIRVLTFSYPSCVSKPIQTFVPVLVAVLEPRLC